MQNLQQAIAETLTEVMEKRENTTSLTPDSSNHLPTSPRENSDNPQAKTQVAAILKTLWVTTEVYGRDESAFPDVVRTFTAFLKEYPAEEVVAAFEKYTRNRSNFPTIADITAILEGRIKPDKPLYMALKKRQQRGEILGYSDEAYIKKYEAQVKEDWE